MTYKILPMCMRKARAGPARRLRGALAGTVTGEAMEEYDPLIAPDVGDWLDTDEGERIELVTAYHRRAKVKLPNVRLHATMHVAVENQVAMGDEVPVRRTFDRLQVVGLDRHEAIHAVGSVLAEHMYDLVNKRPPATDPNTLYWSALEKLTAKGWRRAR